MSEGINVVRLAFQQKELKMFKRFTAFILVLLGLLVLSLEKVAATSFSAAEDSPEPNRSITLARGERQ